MAERVGVLLVHGIGEQGRFEHLEREVRNLVSAWQEGGAQVDIQVNAVSSAAFGARQATWQADRVPPIEVHLEQSGRKVHLDFHEVWWADLDEPTTLVSQLRFWFWGLSLWATRRYVDPNKPAYAAWMRPPSHWGRTGNRIAAGLRMQLFALGIILLMTFFTLSLINFLAEWIFRRRPIPSDILVDYLGDVKLYQQQWRPGKGFLGTLGQPPRVALRQRMVRQMLHMATNGYDRWYILAHSQGTVLAFNALMEPAERLPHYLTESEWKAVQEQLGRPDPSEDAPATTQVELLRGLKPSRPAWLAPQEVVDRKRLFAGLRGFMTYGSPLEHFASLWPAIVSMNRNEAVFRDDFEWINIVDPNDPVATRIRHFDPHHAAQPQPRNVLYRARWWHLLSHLSYLQFQPGSKTRLVHPVCAWLQKGGDFVGLPPGSPDWPTERRARLDTQGQGAIWLAWALGLALAFGDGLHQLLCWASETAAEPGVLLSVLRALCAFSTDSAAVLGILPTWVAHAVVTLLVCATIVFVSGLIARTPLCRSGRL